MMLIHILPHRAQTPDGIGDFATILAEQLQSHHGCSSIFIICNPAFATILRDDGFRNIVSAKTSDSLIGILSDLQKEFSKITVLLHYSGYGFQKRGAPIWLVDALKSWKKNNQNIQLISFVHELFALGKPWKISYWIRPVQMWCTISIAKLSDHIFSNTKNGIEWMSIYVDKRKISYCPIYSTVGEPTVVTSPCNRDNVVIVFGSIADKPAFYSRRDGVVEKILLEIGCTKLIDIGRRNFEVPQDIAGIPIEAMGMLEPHEVSTIMQNSKFGIIPQIPYDFEYLCKSTIFAAYAAHGVVPIVVGTSLAMQSDLSDLMPSEHFLGHALRDKQFAYDSARYLNIQNNICKWYERHRSTTAAAKIAEHILGSVTLS